jgi:uncharacterized membrane protein YgdD (TMEM256/DUF423 family)
MDRTFLLLGSVFGFLGVAFGAFGAHALRARLSAEMLGVFETGVRYQMYHVFAVLLVAAAIGKVGNARLLVIAGWLFVAGIVLFSGSLYALALTGSRGLGAITPVGGLLFLAGWAVLACVALIRTYQAR